MPKGVFDRKITSPYKINKNPKLNRGNSIFKEKRDLYWYNGSKPQKPNEETWRKAEQRAENILIEEGFNDIKKTSSLFGERFPFDYIGEKDGKKFAIEITCGQRKEMSSKLENILKYFNLDLVYIFIKPDFSTYFIKYKDFRKIYCWSDGVAKTLGNSTNINPLILFFNNIIKPFNWDNLQQISYDLTLHAVYEVKGEGSVINGITTLPKYKQIKAWNNIFKLKANHLYSFKFCEKVEVPENMAGMIYPRSSLNRMGCLITSGIYDPGFNNRIGAMARTFQCDIELKKWDRVATILFFWADAASKYNGQYNKENLK